MTTRRPGAAILALALIAATGGAALAQAASELEVGPEDLRISARNDGGYDLFVRKKPGIASVLLTESTKDPALKADNFAYRAIEKNEVNGAEIRLLNGKALPPSSRLYSLLSSSPRSDEAFGLAFRILIPPVLVYGYPWSRSGSVSVGKGTFINIRAFAKPYADYAGAFKDNPYEISISTKPLPVEPPEEPPATQRQPAQTPLPPPPPDDRTSSKIGAALEAGAGKSIDLVVCLDTTDSMVPYVDDIKKNLAPILREKVKGYARFRIGVVLFRDYWPDEYITRKYPFTSDLEVFDRTIKAVTVFGGMDIPEAEFEALYSAATDFDWSADIRQVILVTDAPPHPEPRGKIAFADAAREMKARRIEADAIIEPAKFVPAGPVHAELERVARKIGLLRASDPHFSIYDEGRPAEVSSDEAALSTARAAGAAYIVVRRSLAVGGLSETENRLLDCSTGKTLERDVMWRAVSDGRETVFVNGFRAK